MPTVLRFIGSNYAFGGQYLGSVFWSPRLVPKSHLTDGLYAQGADRAMGRKVMCISSFFGGERRLRCFDDLFGGPSKPKIRRKERKRTGQSMKPNQLMEVLRSSRRTS
jgi:hypothetical protein